MSLGVTPSSGPSEPPPPTGEDQGSTAALVRWLSQAARAPLPDSVLSECRRTLLNVLGVTIGAAHHPAVDALVRTAFRLQGAGTVPLPGREEALTPRWAAQAVGTAAHLEDFDDTHLATVIHPGGVTLAALWSLTADSSLPEGASAGPSAARGRRQLAAAACGIEAQLRIGMAMTPQHYDAGWHITGTCGVIGAAVTAGLLLDAGTAELSAAIAAAASMTLGHREAFGTPVKPLHVGKAAANGLLAAQLAIEDFTASKQVLEAPRGYFGVLSGGVWDAAWLRGDTERPTWLLEENSYKPFPCGIVGHPAIEAALAVRGDLSVGNLQDVESVEVACNPLVPELMGKLEPATGLAAKFSTTYLVAVALLDGRVGIDQVSDARVQAPDVAALRRRVRLVPDEAVGRECATVVVTLADGSVRTSTVSDVIGSVDRPLDDRALDDKFRALSEPVIGAEHANQVIEAVRELGSSTELGDVIAVCRAAPRRSARPIGNVAASRRS